MHRYGATKEEWIFFSKTLGQRRQLLPVVSNPDAKISPYSSLKKVGKVPSGYSHDGLVIGITDWTNMEASLDQVKEWAAQPDYGICLIARIFKAIDVDVKNPILAKKIKDRIRSYLKTIGIDWMPLRSRPDSSKFLVPIRIKGDPKLDKDVIKTEGDEIIEFLSNKQQYIVAGQHEDGCRYEWEDLDEFTGVPTLTMEHFTELWRILREEFHQGPDKGNGLRELKNPYAIHDDPIYSALESKGMLKSTGTVDGSFNIVCPFEHEHSEVSDSEKDSSTTYFPAHTGGYATPSIVCLHAHCQERNTETFKRQLGLDGSEDFENLDEIEGEIIPQVSEKILYLKNKFTPGPCVNFCSDFADVKWLVKNIIPTNSIGTIYGPSGGGKSFVTFDLAAAIARGVTWRGNMVKNQGKVIYVCAEGAAMFKRRIEAYKVEHGLTTEEDLPVDIVAGNPNLLDKVERKSFIQAQKEYYEQRGEKVVFIIFDTYAQCMVGDENSSRDTGLMLRALAEVRDAFEGSSVCAVHHTGKNAELGARGHSSLKAAFDYELKVERLDTKSDTPVRQVSVGKFKDAIEGFRMPFKLKTVRIGIDEDLEPITSCVVEEPKEEELESAIQEAKINNMGVRQRYTLERAEAYKQQYGAWPVRDVLIDEMFKYEQTKPQEDKNPRPRWRIKGGLKQDIEAGHFRVDRDDRVIPTCIEPETDENAVSENLAEDNS